MEENYKSVLTVFDAHFKLVCLCCFRYLCNNFFIKGVLSTATFEHRLRSQLSSITIDGKIVKQDDR